MAKRAPRKVRIHKKDAVEAVPKFDTLDPYAWVSIWGMGTIILTERVLPSCMGEIHPRRPLTSHTEFLKGEKEEIASAFPGLLFRLEGAQV